MNKNEVLVARPLAEGSTLLVSDTAADLAVRVENRPDGETWVIVLKAGKGCSYRVLPAAKEVADDLKETVNAIPAVTSADVEYAAWVQKGVGKKAPADVDQAYAVWDADHHKENRGVPTHYETFLEGWRAAVAAIYADCPDCGRVAGQPMEPHGCPACSPVPRSRPRRI